MDVIALDQAGIAEAVAPLGTALTEAQLGLLWRLSPDPAPLLRRRRGRAEGGGPRGAAGAAPCRARAARSASSPCPPGQDPDDLIRASGRAALRGAARRARIAGRPALAARAATPSRSRRPSRRPGLRRAADRPCRGDRRPGRARPVSRRAARAASTRSTGAAARALGARPARPLRAAAAPDLGPTPRAVGRTGLSPRARPRGARRGWSAFPALIGDHAEAIAALPLGEGTPAAAARPAARSGDDARRA